MDLLQARLCICNPLWALRARRDGQESGSGPSMSEQKELSTSGSDAPPQVVDPAVSREKFDAEIAGFRKVEREHQERGWWLLDVTFPNVFAVFATPHLRPPAVVTGVQFDFTNYDLEPPSVRLVDPFTRRPFLMKELPTVLLRSQVAAVPGMPGGAPAPMGMQFVTAAPL